MIPKFRIFDKDTKEWQSIRSIGLEEDGSVRYIRCTCESGDAELDEFYFIDNLGVDFELMQSTGLRDKNGIEIYEGDILNHPLQGMRKVYYPFTDRVASYGLENIENGMRNTLQDTHRVYEIIGNIHEHSHLLDVEGKEMINVQQFLNHKALEKQKPAQGGTQYIFSFDNGYGASVVNHSISYTNSDDEWELAVLKDTYLTYDTPITDDVIGHLEVDEVLTLLDKIERL